MISPAGSFDDDLIGHDIIARAAVDGAKGEYCRIEWVDLTADDILYCRQKLTGRHYRIGTAMRHSGVTGLATDSDRHVI